MLNKSWDANGGRMFRKVIRPTMLERLRAGQLRRWTASDICRSPQGGRYTNSPQRQLWVSGCKLNRELAQ
jgi:hypothetical protein